MGWTDEQLNAIAAEGMGIVVSAAAGSGKTSVLVERLIRVLSDTENKTPADRLIVVTFTNDAAAQMKQRLSDALSEKLTEEPDNLWLCSQQALLQTAKISTIHSFCFDLIRENIRSLNVSAGFRILDDTEEMLLKRRAVEKVFENFYSKCPDVINRLVDFFSGGDRDDANLEDILLEAYDFLMSIPYYDDWINEKIAFFEQPFDPENDPFAQILLRELETVYRDALNKAEYVNDWFEAAYAEELAKKRSKDCNYGCCIQNERDKLKIALNKLLSENNVWDDRVAEIEFDGRFTAPVQAAKDDNEDRVQRFGEMKNIRDSYKKAVADIQKGVFTYEQIKSDYEVHAEIMKALQMMIAAFSSELAELKAEKNALGFSDAEQLTIRLLTEKNDKGEICRTPLAVELSDYYSMIMIDEFQDANNNQDLIFKMLSKGGTPERGGTNLFVVGDVKQSIYRFRLANPKLFIDVLNKSEPYTKEGFEGTNAAIYLNKNFRSSEPVIDFVNYIFGSLMSRTTGELDYTENEKLVKGLEYPEADRTTEFITIPENEGDEGNAVDEPYAAAQKISSMIGRTKVYDKGVLRPCEPKDFCILLRGKKEAEAYVKALAERGVKAHAEEPEGYLESREISVLVNLLAVIDNPMQNIPLVSVLMSPMFMITAEEMAKLAVEKGKEDKYFRVIKRVLEDETKINKESALYAKLKRFMQIFDKLRYCAASQRLERFIRTIYDSTDFLSAVQVYSDGSQKRANLHLLLDIAESYETNSGGGISGFVRYVDMILKKNGKMHHASTVSASDNAVSVKTIHKSKGLEYPFVFLCGTSKKFNDSDVKSSVIMNSDYGISFKIQDREKLKSYNSFPHFIMSKIERSSLASEEMRLMYVAFTRAREKLFITVPEKERGQKRLEELKREIMVSGGLTTDIISRADSMLYWISAAMLVHPDGEWFRDGEDIPTVKTAPAVRFVQAEPDELNNEKTEAETVMYDMEKVSRLRAAFTFSYDSGLTDKSAKITVTEIAKSGDEDKLYLRRPEFAAEKGGLTAAEKGTATHTFMQYADFAAAENDAASEAERLVEMGLLTEEECGSINPEQISGFFASDLYQRLKKSNNVRREQKFLIKKSDAALDDDRLMEYNNSSMLQGIADCMFEEDDGIVIIDYKTDRVNSDSVLVARYDLQLKLYSAALGQIFGKPVKEAYLYSFALGRAV
ncbi:MAG: helicase-exonuclease AddAB subunit AddA, partial [Oscillospiraceae bacterium]|nr:helicase-exonuclease AddAB subunit AddA [Oscillospiraceae bacterium]